MTFADLPGGTGVFLDANPLVYHFGIEKVPQLGVQVLTIPGDMIATAAAISQQHGLLSNDALVVAVMQANGLANLASNDVDFDRVPGINRYGAT